MRECQPPGGSTMGATPGIGTPMVCCPRGEAEVRGPVDVPGAWPVLTDKTMVEPGAAGPVMLWPITVPWVLPLAWPVWVT